MSQWDRDFDALAWRPKYIAPKSKLCVTRYTRVSSNVEGEYSRISEVYRLLANPPDPVKYALSGEYGAGWESRTAKTLILSLYVLYLYTYQQMYHKETQAHMCVEKP